MSDPLDVKPTAQIVYLSSGTLGDVFNGDAGSGSTGLRITSGLFSVWRGAGVAGESQLFYGAVAFLALSIVFAFAGWYHNHVAVPESSCAPHQCRCRVGMHSVDWSHP